MKKSENYRVFETTGDVGIYVYGKDLEELFINAGKALFEIITKVKKGECEEREISISSDSLENLFINWLNELIFLFDVDGLVAVDFDLKITKNDSFILNSVIYYYIFDYENDEKLLLIKAATYHKFYFKKTENGYEARVIFDI